MLAVIAKGRVPGIERAVGNVGHLVDGVARVTFPGLVPFEALGGSAGGCIGRSGEEGRRGVGGEHEGLVVETAAVLGLVGEKARVG